VFDISRIDVDVKLGDVEERTLINNTDERHTFHIDQLDFLVQSVNGNPLEMTGMRDNVNMPFRDPKTRAPGIVKVKITFTNPLIVGKFPFHSHILEHEDGGMMANVRVRPASRQRLECCRRVNVERGRQPRQHRPCILQRSMPYACIVRGNLERPSVLQPRERTTSQGPRLQFPRAVLLSSC
jgi:hypothetical protein